MTVSIVRGIGRVTAAALAAMALATNQLPIGGPLYAGVPRPKRGRRNPETPADFASVAAAEAKRERRAARNRAK